MVHMARLKHQQRGFSGIDAGAIERDAVHRSCEWNVGFNVVKDLWIVADVSSLEKDDGEVCRHGVDLLSRMAWAARAVAIIRESEKTTPGKSTKAQLCRSGCEGRIEACSFVRRQLHHSWPIRAWPEQDA